MRTAQAVTGAGGIPVGYATLVARLRRPSARGVVWILRRLARAPLGRWRRTDAMSLPELADGLRPRSALVALRRCSAAPTSAPASGSCSAAGGERGERVREHAHDAMGAGVGGQPRLADLRARRVLDRLPGRVRLDRLDARASRCSSPALGIILRGAAYALRSGAATIRARRARIDARVRALVGPDAVRARRRGRRASPPGRVPVGNAAGDLVTSWLNPTSILVGRARGRLRRLPGRRLPGRRRGRARRRRPRARPSARGRSAPALVAGALALAGLVVLHHDAPALYDGLVAGDGLRRA